MRKHQHQTVDRRLGRPAPEGPRAGTSWRELEAESAARVFAGGTSPGTLFDEGDDEPTGSLRTRVTYAGKGTATHEVRDGGAAVLAALSGEAPGVDGDLMRASRLPSAADRTQLWRVMTPRVVCAAPDLETDALIAILIDLDLRAVPVVDVGGRPIGIVSRSDLLGRSHNGNGRPPEHVVDVMMSLAFSLPETASLSRAAAVMAYECIHRIPVVALDGTVVGIISSLDVVRWLARHDGYVVPDGGCGGD
jgi:CBS domain-containing protein